MKYTDRSLFGKRCYELRDTAIFASGTTSSGSRFEVSIDYSDLNPNPERIWLRSPLLWGGVGVVGISIVLLTALGVFQAQDKAFLTGYAYVMAFTGVILMLMSLRKIEMVRFKSLSGVPSLDVFKVGPMKAHFDTFIYELQSRIQKRRSPNLPAAGNAGIAPQSTVQNHCPGVPEPGRYAEE